MYSRFLLDVLCVIGEDTENITRRKEEGGEIFVKKIIKHDNYFSGIGEIVDETRVEGKVGSKKDFVVSKFSIS